MKNILLLLSGNYLTLSYMEEYNKKNANNDSSSFTGRPLEPANFSSVPFI